MLLKASCRWFGAAAIIPTKTVLAGLAKVGVCRASAFIRDVVGLAYIDDQGRLFPLPEVDEDDEEPVLFESEQIWFSKNLDEQSPKMRLLSVSLLEGLPAFGEMVRVGSPLVRYEYNNSGDLVHVIAATVRSKAASATNAAGLVSEYEYDHYTPTGKVLRNWTSLGEEWRFTYHDGYTEVTDVLGYTEQYHYDDNNELVKRVFADGSTNLMECDKLRRDIYKAQSKFVSVTNSASFVG